MMVSIFKRISFLRRKDALPQQKLREATEHIRQNNPDGSVLLTQDTYLTIDSSAIVPVFEAEARILKQLFERHDEAISAFDLFGPAHTILSIYRKRASE